jgi:hypothetical protein
MRASKQNGSWVPLDAANPTQKKNCQSFRKAYFKQATK